MFSRSFLFFFCFLFSAFSNVEKIKPKTQVSGEYVLKNFPLKHWQNFFDQNRGENSFAFELVKDEFSKKYIHSPVKTMKLRLANGLEVYLISDPVLSASGASLAVEVGSWQDSQEFPGMAHFVEHLLFMGTEAFPQENDYQEYLTDRGGFFNAMTFHDRTVYGFTIPSKGFEGALERFSHFFIDPLFSPDSISKEIHAIDHEFGDNLDDDFLRMWRVFKATGNLEHPNAIFSIGNKKSLATTSEGDVKKWFKQHYIPSKMHLLVISPLPLDQLHHLVSKYFSMIPPRSENSLFTSSRISSSNQRGHLIHIESSMNNKLLLLCWEIPADFSKLNFEKKITKLFKLVLNESSDKSLERFLKKEKLARDLIIDSWKLDKEHLIFTLGVNLTPKGLAEIDSVISYCFRGIALLREKEFPPGLLAQYQKRQKKKLEYQTPQDLFALLMRRGAELVDEPLETFPLKTIYSESFDDSYVSTFANILIPETAIYFLIADSQEARVLPNSIERWMGTPYLIRPLSENKLNTWKVLPPHPEIDFPEDDLKFFQNLIEGGDQQTLEKEEIFLLQDDKKAHLEFMTSQTLAEGEMGFFFTFHTPEIDRSLKSEVLAEVFFNVLEHTLERNGAGEELTCYFFSDESGLNGLIESKKKNYIDRVGFLLQMLKEGNFSEELFQEAKEELLQEHQRFSSSLTMATQTLDSILFQHVFTVGDRKRALQNLSFEEFILFSKNLFRRGFLEGIIMANISLNKAHEVWNIWKNILAHSFWEVEEKEDVYFTFPEKGVSQFILMDSPHHVHAMALVIEEGDLDKLSLASQQILHVVLKSAFFDELRTKQQVAYTCQVEASFWNNKLYEFFALQSSSCDSYDLLNRCEVFLEQFTSSLKDRVSKERFHQIASFLLKSLQSEGKDKAPSQLEYGLQELTYEQFLRYANKFFNQKNRKRLAVLVAGAQDHHSSSQPISNYFFTNKDEIIVWKISN